MFFFPIKTNAQISKATTYKWPYNSTFTFVQRSSGLSFLHVEPLNIRRAAAFRNKKREIKLKMHLLPESK